MKKTIHNKAEKKGGLVVKRLFTSDKTDVYDNFKYESRTSVIRNPSGEEVFRLDHVEVPAGWSQVATDILAQKYFRKTGVPSEKGNNGSEHSVKQVVHRMASTWKHWGETHGYFASESDGKIFY